MRRKNQFDEVMIVNPSQGSTNSNQRVRLMRFHNVYPPEMGYYAEPERYGYYAEPEAYGYYAEPQTYGYYGEADPTMGYYGQVDPALGYYGEADPTMGYYGQVDPAMAYYGEVDPAMGYYGQVDPAMAYYGEVDPAMGYYGEVDPAMGYYGEVDPAMGYYGQAPEFAGVAGWDGYGAYQPPPSAEPVGYFAEENPIGYYGEDPNQAMGYYAQAPEMVGYGEAEPQFAEDYPGMAFYGEPEFAEPEFAGYSGYTRDMPPAFNAGCPLPTNLSGYDEVDGFNGYATPATVNPTCDTMTSQPGTAPSPPETFKPLWSLIKLFVRTSDHASSRRISQWPSYKALERKFICQSTTRSRSNPGSN